MAATTKNVIPTPHTTLWGAAKGPAQADLINAIDGLSRDMGCDLINMSLGGGPPSKGEEDAIRDAVEGGTLCICSAGNKAGLLDCPAAYPEWAAVSATGQVGWAPAVTFSPGNRPNFHNLVKRNNGSMPFSEYGPFRVLVTDGPTRTSGYSDSSESSGSCSRRRCFRPFSISRS